MIAATEGAAADVPSSTLMVSPAAGGKVGALAGLQVLFSYEHTSQRVAIMDTSGSARVPKLLIPATLACQLGCEYPPLQLPAVVVVMQLLKPPPPPEMKMKGLAPTPLMLAVLQNAIGSGMPKALAMTGFAHESFHTISGMWP